MVRCRVGGGARMRRDRRVARSAPPRARLVRACPRDRCIGARGGGCAYGAARRLGPRKVAHGPAIVAVGLAVVFFALAGGLHSEHLLTDRDPGVYINEARLVVRTHELDSVARVGPFRATAFGASTPGFAENRHGRLIANFLPMLPVELAIGLVGRRRDGHAGRSGDPRHARSARGLRARFPARRTACRVARTGALGDRPVAALVRARRLLGARRAGCRARRALALSRGPRPNVRHRSRSWRAS